MSDKPKTEIDLSIIQSDELIFELRTRFDRMLFVGMRNLSGTKYDVKLRWKDLPTDGIGLAHYAADKIQGFADLEEDEPVDGDEGEMD